MRTPPLFKFSLEFYSIPKVTRTQGFLESYVIAVDLDSGMGPISLLLCLGTYFSRPNAVRVVPLLFPSLLLSAASGPVPAHGGHVEARIGEARKGASNIPRRIWDSFFGCIFDEGRPGPIAFY